MVINLDSKYVFVIPSEIGTILNYDINHFTIRVENYSEFKKLINIICTNKEIITKDLKFGLKITIDENSEVYLDKDIIFYPSLKFAFSHFDFSFSSFKDADDIRGLHIVIKINCAYVDTIITYNDAIKLLGELK